MLQRNKDFAAHQSAAGALMPSLPRSLPNAKAIVIGCADMRVDPSYVLGIKPGEAVVIRNIGGRITPGTVGGVGPARTNRSGSRSDSRRRRGVPHHRASAHRLRHHAPYQRPRPVDALFSNTGQSNSRPKRSPILAQRSPWTSLRSGRFRALPGEWLISGLVYDVATGLVEIVVPPAPIRTM